MKSRNPITALLFPDKCILCCKLLEATEHSVCHQCSTDTSEALVLKRRIPFLKGAFALWYYENNVRSSLLRFKFHRRRSYAQSYGAFLAAKLSRVQEKYDLIVWVPVSKWRKLKRGYDQVELIAHALCRELQITPVSCLKKIRHNPPQSGIASAAQRRANVLGAYKVREPALVKGKRILLLDDIITTGATISECAKTLMAAGAKEVYGAAVAAARQHKINQ
jgi:ComF family protein